LEYHEFIEFYKGLLKKPECEKLFQQINSNAKLLSDKELLSFINKSQFEKLELEDVINVMKSQKAIETSNGFCFTEPDFQRFLFSHENSAFNPKAKPLYQDMTRPLSEYWISSSHNTYLEGNQLTGTSSVAIYKKVLLMGCRCVELDCWDGSNNDPIITHGHTLTSKIKFTDVINCIKENAFKASEYPVILSIENHCGEDQQKFMAKYMIETFGDLLWYGEFSEFPSPDKLKKKILLKNKKLPKDGKTVEDEEDDDDDEEVKTVEEEDDLILGGATSLVQKAPDDKLVTQKSETKKGKVLAKEFSDITVFDGKKFKSWSQTHEVYEMHSLKEGKVTKLIKKDYKSYCKFTSRQFIRTYPKGTRINSSNYDPTPGETIFIFNSN
jgi:phosphatidylinositol phospholipase C, delta